MARYIDFEARQNSFLTITNEYDWQNEKGFSSQWPM